MQTLGFFLCLSVYVLLSIHIYAFFAVIARVLKKRLGVLFGLVWIAIGMSLVYNLVFNHFWSMIIKPGGPRDLIENEQLRKDIKNRESRKAARVKVDGKVDGAHSLNESEDDRFEGLQKDVKRLMKYRTKTMGSLRGFWNLKCPHCQELKPARTHHCSISEACVFQMSHYCLFTNNCVGLENQRYFLLFILYTFIGSTYMLISIISIWKHHIYSQNLALMNFLVCFDGLLSFCLFFYNIWCWFLAGSGLTTVEFMGRNTGYKSNHYDFTFSRVRDNLFKVFGTKSYFAMLSPSLRYNPFNGIEWSFQMKDLGFNEYGEVSSKYAENDEENKLKPATEMTNVSGSAVMAEDDDPEGEEEAENTEIAI
jgi:hypothetical protein